jgi:kynurenine formamidase
MEARAIAVAGLLLAVTSGAHAQSAARVVDLGHPLGTSDPSWEGTPGLQRTTTATFDKDGYAAGRVTIDEHFGTHVDAPSHFSKEGWTVDRIPADRLYRPGVCIDVAAKAAKDADYRVTVDDIKSFEKTAGAIPRDSIVFIATGWDRFWNDRARYMNERSGVKHFPGLAQEAVAYLAGERGVAAIGIDTPSIDYGPSTAFEAHKVSMALNVYHIENAARLSSLPRTGFMVVVAPMAIRGGSGAPARVLAIVP